MTVVLAPVAQHVGQRLLSHSMEDLRHRRGDPADRADLQGDRQSRPLRLAHRFPQELHRSVRRRRTASGVNDVGDGAGTTGGTAGSTGTVHT